MKISIFTTITDALENQYPLKEAIECYAALADEVVIVDGSDQKTDENYISTLDKGVLKKIKLIKLPWPREWKWRELPVHLNVGLDQCTGDWCLKMDIDYLVHENDFGDIRQKLEQMLHVDAIKISSFLKFNIYNKTHGAEKAEIQIGIKGKFKNEIRFGETLDRRTDWCVPMKDCKFNDKKGIWEGCTFQPHECWFTRAKIYNYDIFFKTKEVAKKGFWPFARAYNDAFPEMDGWGKSEDEAFKVLMGMLKGRTNKKVLKEIESHPAFVRDRIAKMGANEFGYNNYNNFEGLC